MQKYSHLNAILSPCVPAFPQQNSRVSTAIHIPVLLAEVLHVLHPQEGEAVLDATLGLGGHSAAFLDAIGEKGTLVALDADEQNLADAKAALQGKPGNAHYLHRNFRDVQGLPSPLFDVIFADLGVSSPHFDDPVRGFSFRADAPLDMRFDRSSGMTASQFIRIATEQELVEMFRMYGEFPGARRLASLLKAQLPETTSALRSIVETAYGFRAPSILPQVFQALRIAVNDEIGALKSFLETAPTLLRPGGRLGIISFHSLEDRLVKQCFRTLTTAEVDQHTGAPLQEPDFLLPQRKPISASAEEAHQNPRSRSAKFRSITRRLP
jgi:16S rRNA (cytosine1402-N4)-methyltransferase